MSVAVTVAVAALAACTQRGASPDVPPPPNSAARASTASSAVKHEKIQHIVVVMQENRSFDNLFQGFVGANTVSIGKNSKGQSISLQPVPLEATWGLAHSSKDFFAACDGLGAVPGTNCKMDGFDNETAYGPGIPPNPEYGYVPHNETQLYFQIAQAYVLADNMFTSHIDASFVSHQYMIAGQSKHAVDLPAGPWGCGGRKTDTVTTLNQDRTYGPPEGVCFTYPTVADELDAKGLTWRYYSNDSSQPTYIWSAYQAIQDIYNGPDWTNDVITPPQQFLTDVQNGTLANVTWVTPDCSHSDHATCLGNQGPQWVASIVNAVGQSNYWSTTTIFVMWDEWGGWYDHVAPPYVDYDGLGFRVPLIIIGPYVKQNVVSHVQYEHGSILRYIEDTFGLKRLAASDRRANSPVPDAIDYKQKPRVFTPFASGMRPGDFFRAPRDPRRPDDD